MSLAPRPFPLAQLTAAVLMIAAVVIMSELRAAQTSVRAAIVVGSLEDAPDAQLGDGRCAALDGTCTLRAVVMEANVSVALDIIMLPEGTYVLSLVGAGEDFGAVGDLDIRGDLALAGAGSSSTTIDGRGSVQRVFDIFAPTHFVGVTFVNAAPSDTSDTIRVNAPFTATETVGLQGSAGLGPGAESAFMCTQIIGYSTTSTGFPSAEAELDSRRWQLLFQHGGALVRWANPDYDGWTRPLVSPCVDSSERPDRIVLDLGPDSYTTDVSALVADIRISIETVRNKYPSVRQIVLQPEHGGPNHAGCSWPGATQEMVRATYSHTAFDAAIAVVVGGVVVHGADPLVGYCSDFADRVGHLTPSGAAELGERVGRFYAQW
jgi:hypothetical protein